MGPVKRHLWLIFLGLVSSVVFALATLPAYLVTGRVQKFGIQAAGVTGSVWSARAETFVWRGLPLGSLDWRVNPLLLLTGQLGGHVRIARPDGKFEADVAAGRTGLKRIANARIDLAIEDLANLQVGVPAGWRGRLKGQVDEINFSEGWPSKVRGKLDVTKLAGPPPWQLELGSYRVVLPNPAPPSPDAQPQTITAQVVDAGGPFAVTGKFELDSDRSFLLDGQVAPRAEVPENIRNALEVLGPADSAGRRPFGISGSL